MALSMILITSLYCGYKLSRGRTVVVMVSVRPDVDAAIGGLRLVQRCRGKLKRVINSKPISDWSSLVAWWH
jgi:hypothetical protein